MYKLIKTFAFAMLLLFISTSAQAQLKFGHVNAAELVSMMPETKSADDQVKKFTDDLNQQLQVMLAELQTKYQAYQKDMNTMSEVAKEMRGKEIQDLQQRIDDFQQSAQERIQRKKEDLYSPILKKAEVAIKDVAKEGKYSYIFDTSMGAVLHAQESDDIMDLVKKKLNLPATATPSKAPEPKK